MSEYLLTELEPVNWNMVLSASASEESSWSSGIVETLSGTCFSGTIVFETRVFFTNMGNSLRHGALFLRMPEASTFGTYFGHGDR